MATGTCALCLEDRTLCDSHILPELFYADVYDDDHFMLEISSVENRHRKRRPKGWYEPLLCRPCEEIFQKYEDEGVKLRDRNGISITKIGNIAYKVEGFDYTKLKLFALSILWRMGVSAKDSYAEVQLGDFAETLRLMLLEGKPGTVGDFGTIIGFVNHEGEPATKYIYNPSRCDVVNQNTGENILGYGLLAAGVRFWFFVCTADKAEADMITMYIQEGGWFYASYEEMLKITGLADSIAQIAINDANLRAKRKAQKLAKKPSQT